MDRDQCSNFSFNDGARDTTLRRLLWITGIFSLSLLGPTQETVANRPSDPSTNNTRVASDSSLFAAAVQWIKNGGFIESEEIKRYPLRIDPRPLRPGVEQVMSDERYMNEVDSSAQRRRQVIRQRLAASNLGRGDFAAVDSSVLRHRTAVLRRLNVPKRDALTYSDECLLACDPRMIKEDEADRVECPKKRCEVTMITLSLPVRSGPLSLRDEHVQKTLWVIRLTPMLHFLHELTFQRTDHGWKMIKEEVVTGGGM